MADVATATSRRIDSLLSYLTELWEELPRAAEEIDSWDIAEQIDYIEEWTPRLQNLQELRGYAAAGQLSDEQRSRYERLEALVRQHEPLLRELRSS